VDGAGDTSSNCVGTRSNFEEASWRRAPITVTAAAEVRNMLTRVFGSDGARWPEVEGARSATAGAQCTTMESRTFGVGSRF
jgi:hypothetical protein